jgi:hypothetical protein
MNSAVIDGRLSPVRPSRWGSWGFKLKKLLAFSGPGYLVAVGYMDPGNWATSLAGGSSFGYSLLRVIFLSNVMAMLLQAAAVRLGIATGMDLAQSCRHFFGPRLSIVLWLGCEVAIVACNLAEVLGMACGLQLLFHLPLSLGVCLTVLDVFLVLLLQRRGARYLETFIISLIALIGACFAVQLWWLHPYWAAVAEGFVPTTDELTHSDMLYLAVGIIGATVMPHNLYLHSSLVQTRRQDISERGLTRAIRYATWDSNVALVLALLVNVGILILAAGAFHRPDLAPFTTFRSGRRERCVWDWPHCVRFELVDHWDARRPNCDGGVFKPPRFPCETRAHYTKSRDSTRHGRVDCVWCRWRHEAFSAEPSRFGNSAAVCGNPATVVHHTISERSHSAGTQL